MIKKLKGINRNNSMLDFALEISQQYKVNSIGFQNKKDQRIFNNEKNKTFLRSDALINGKKIDLPKKFEEEDNKENRDVGKTVKLCKKIQFYDEKNKILKFNSFEEKYVKFTKSNILPKIKIMKVDNDVLTDDEQLTDAKGMMFDNLKETIEQIKKLGNEYLTKNLSKKITFCNKKARK
jgi:hypothetical protein